MKSRGIFFRAAVITAVILSCVIGGGVGICRAYENTRRTAYGDYRPAVEYKDGILKFFDFEIEIINNKISTCDI